MYRKAFVIEEEGKEIAVADEHGAITYAEGYDAEKVLKAVANLYDAAKVMELIAQCGIALMRKGSEEKAEWYWVGIFLTLGSRDGKVLASIDEEGNIAVGSAVA